MSNAVGKNLEFQCLFKTFGQRLCGSLKWKLKEYML